MPHNEKTAPARAASPNNLIKPNKMQPDFQVKSKIGVLPVDLLRCLLDRRNPCHADNHAGSYSINLNTGKWSHSATRVRGSDAARLAAYLGAIQQIGGAV